MNRTDKTQEARDVDSVLAPARIELTIALIASEWDDDQLKITLDSIALLAKRSTRCKLECLVVEILPADTDIQSAALESITELPLCVREALEYKDFEYFVEIGFTSRSLRKLLMNCEGSYVLIIGEGDRVGGVNLDLQKHNETFLSITPCDSAFTLGAIHALERVSTETPGLAALVNATLLPVSCIAMNRLSVLPVLDRLNQYSDMGPLFKDGIREVLIRLIAGEANSWGFCTNLGLWRTHKAIQADSDELDRRNIEGIRDYLYSDSLNVPLGNKIICDFAIEWSLAIFRVHSRMPQDSHSHNIDFSYPLNHLALDKACTTSNRAETYFESLISIICKIWDTPIRRATHKGKEIKQINNTADLIRVSVITSLFKESKRIYGFLQNLVSGSTFNKGTEIVAVIPTPDSSSSIILDFYAIYTPNIRPIYLQQDPGIYECWNIAIRASRGEYVTNANADDRRGASHIEKAVYALEMTNASIASTAILVIKDEEMLGSIQYGSNLADAASKDCEVWYADSEDEITIKGIDDLFLYNAEGQISQCYNFPHCMPVWKRSLHDTYGYFDEGEHGTYADFAFWLLAGSNGTTFAHINQALGVYTERSDSHNRVNANPGLWMRLVRQYHPTRDIAQISQHAVFCERESSAEGSYSNITEDKFETLFGKQLSQSYGNHRSGWGWAIAFLRTANIKDADFYCDLFIEKKFVWGSDDGDAYSCRPSPHLKPWVGFIHVPPNVPRWFQFEQSNRQVFRSKLFRASARTCRGLITLTHYHRRALIKEYGEKLPFFTIHHPTEYVPVQKRFRIDSYLDSAPRRIVQVGWWLRKLSAINHIAMNDTCIPTLLGTNNWSKALILYSERRFFALRDKMTCEKLDFLSNQHYDQLLASCVVFIDFYDTSANNAIIECIARGTPCLVPRHPAIEEYLGSDYPLYYNNYNEISSILDDKGKLVAASSMMLSERLQELISVERFVNSFAEAIQYFKSFPI